MTINVDLRDALRRMARMPGTAAVGILTLALGIGATTAIFALAYAIWLKPLPYGDPERLIALTAEHGATGRSAGLAAPEIADYNAATASLEGVAGYSYDATDARVGGDRVRLVAHRASPNLFDVLRVVPARGPGFSPSRASGPEVVLSHAAWGRHFGSDPNIVGRAWEIDRTSYTIVGVMPREFRFPLGLEADVWLRHTFDDGDRAARLYQAVARLRPGVTLESAQKEVSAVARRLASAYPSTNEGWSARATLLAESTRAAYGRPFGTLLAVSGLLLCMACANVASLLLTRSVSRRGELAVRLALGATRARLGRELLVESAIWSAIGLAIGVLLAYDAIPLLKTFLPAKLPRLDDVHVDASVLGISAAVAMLSTSCGGLIPLMGQRGLAPGAAPVGSERTVAGDPSRFTERAIIVTEVALAVVLIVVGGLMVRAFGQLAGEDRGFDPNRLLTLNVSLPFDESRYPSTSSRAAAFEEVLQRTARVPGVIGVGATTGFPGSPLGILGIAVLRPEDARSKQVVAAVHAIGGDYFRTMGLPLRAGHLFEPRDSRSRVVVVNRTLAERLWRDERTTGRTLDIPPIRGLTSESASYEVIGVVGDMRINRAPTPALYLPLSAASSFWIDLMARTTVDPAVAGIQVRQALRGLKMDLLIENVRGMDRVITDSIALQRAQTYFTGFVAIVAAVLSMIGLYGVLSYMTLRRTRELGVRAAVGAAPRQLLTLVIKEAVRLTGSGLAIGLGAALVAVQLLRAQVFGLMSPHWAVFVLAAALLLATAVVAAWVPARRVLRTDPLTALRQ